MDVASSKQPKNGPRRFWPFHIKTRLKPAKKKGKNVGWSCSNSTI